MVYNAFYVFRLIPARGVCRSSLDNQSTVPFLCAAPDLSHPAQDDNTGRAGNQPRRPVLVPRGMRPWLTRTRPTFDTPA